MILNVLHRPDKPVRRGLFELEQGFAHTSGFRTTIFMTAESLDDPLAIELARSYATENGDEIGLSFHGLAHDSIVRITGHAHEAIWLLANDHKRAVVDYLVGRFVQEFDVTPTSVAAYHLDASTMRIVRECVPSVTAAVAGCFEEGVRVFHGCNNSWYLFNEGMPWNPWYPSNTHTLRPAHDEDDWCGIVAIPHLMRDMVLSFEGRNDFWASHPPNVMRGMGYLGDDCPYDRNLIDMFRWQEQFNDGFSYYNTFVSTAWLADHHAIDDTPEVAQSLYRQQLEYLGSLKRSGEVHDMTVSEFAGWFRENRPIGTDEAYFAKELLYGSKKHYFWHIDPDQRILIDATQGGSIGDLRPYIGRVPVETGPEGNALWYGSYPYLVQSQHRTGIANHFQDGARSTAFVSHGGASLDLATLRTRIAQVQTRSSSHERVRVVTLEPVTASVGGVRFTVTTTVEFHPGARTAFRRRFRIDDPARATVTLREQIKAAPGVTEYPQSMEGVEIEANGAASESIVAAYRGRELACEGASSVRCRFDEVDTWLSIEPGDNAAWNGAAQEGHLYSPFVTLALERTVGNGEESIVWITMSR